MALLSMNEVTTYRWSLEQDLKRYRKAGFEAIGVWRQKMQDCGEDRAVDLVAESGLRVSNLSWAGGFTGSDGRTLEESVRDALQAVRVAAELDAGCLVLYAGGRNNHTSRHAMRVLRAALDRVLDVAADYDVTLALEPMHPACAADWTFITDLSAALELVESFRTPYLKLVFDTYHFGSAALEENLLADLAPHVAVVHLGDRREPHSIDQHRVPLGSGRLPLWDLIRRLGEAGYAGDFDVELIGPEIEPARYDDLLRASQAFYERALAPVGGS